MKFIQLTASLIAVMIFTSFALAETLFVKDNFNSLIGDRIGLFVGDKISIIIRENTSAISSADTTTARDSEMNAAFNYNSGPHGHSEIAKLGLGVNRNTSGKGQTERAGKIQAEITATILAVEANGDVRIAGEKMVAINDENQMIRVEGVVRKADISSNNTVESNRLAQTRITINGEGDLTNSQRQGWFTKIMDWLRIF